MDFAWLILILSGMFEAVWALTLAESKGFKKPLPTIVFIVSLIISVAGLAYAMLYLPVGTAYAVWVGVGASLTVAIAFLRKSEPVSIIKVLLLLGLVACVIGLKVVS